VPDFCMVQAMFLSCGTIIVILKYFHHMYIDAK